MRKDHTASRRRLPPLNALRAFEVCARTGSTVAAAAELGVTHGAVSKQVAQLETWLGVALFDRGGPRLAPTAAGARYAVALGQALDHVAEATRAIERSGQEGASIVRVSTTGSFAALWLLPRLPAFRARHPGIEVWVSQTRDLVAPGAGGGIDLALRSGPGPWPGVRAEALMDDALIPVCAPALAKRLGRPENLATAVLLHDEDPRALWPDWLDHAGLGRPAWAARGPRLADGALLLEAAAAGQGVALARRRLAAVFLADGRLAQPFGPALPLGPHHWLVLPPRGTPVSRAARKFAAFMRAAAQNA